jgi:hypothetical protein
MATILSDAEVDDIRAAVAPEAGDEDVVTVEVWRRAAALAPVEGGAGKSRLGVAVSTGTDVLRPDRGFAKVDEYPARFYAKVGAEFVIQHEGRAVIPFQFSFNWNDNPDIEGSDELRIGSERYLVKSPGEAGVYRIMRSVLAVKVG